MVIGQGAGVAAALAAAEDVSVQELDYSLLRRRLTAQGQVLELPLRGVRDLVDHAGGILLDDTAAEFAGSWARSTRFQPYIGEGYRFTPARDAATRGDGKSSATFRFRVPKSGRYRVLMAYSAHASRAGRVPVTVTSGAHAARLEVDQTTPLADGALFRPIGTAELDAGAETVLTVSDEGADGFVILDALRLLPVP